MPARIQYLSCLIAASSCTHNKCNQVCDVRKVRHYCIVHSSYSSARKSKPCVWVQIVEALWMWRSLGHFLQRCNIRWWVIEREWNSWNKETIAWSLVLSAFCGFRKQNTQTFILDLKCVHDRDIRILILGTNAKWDEKWRENTSGPFCKLNKHIQFPDKQQVPAHQYHHHQYFAN